MAGLRDFERDALNGNAQWDRDGFAQEMYRGRS